MLRNLRTLIFRKYSTTTCLQSQTFLTNEYKCVEAWNSQTSSSFINKVNLNDFYNILDQNYISKGVLSAIDVDIFANAVKDATYLEELKDLLHKLRLTAETQNTLESTHHATIRNYLEYGNLPDLVNILNDPLNFGVFLDSYSANILLDKLTSTQEYELAAKVASIIMLQEDYSHDITNALCKFSCYKYLLEPKKENPPPEDTKVKVEEVKIRVKFLRNPYFDDHFDLKDLHLLSGKTLAWISNTSMDNVSNNLKAIGWLFYKKYDKMLSTVDELCKSSTFKVYPEVLQLIERELVNASDEDKNIIQRSSDLLKATAAVTEVSLEDSIKIEIENAINKLQNKDIAAQKQLFENWTAIREQKLEEQSKRLDRAKRIKDIEQKQKTLQVEEQKLWFFENEEKIDLQIEEKQAREHLTATSVKEKSDENYIPPEILPKKRS